MAKEGAQGVQEKELSSLGRIYKELGAGDIDEMLKNICEGCAIKEACGKSVAKCNGLGVITIMAIDKTIGALASVVAPLYARDLKEAIAAVKK